MKDKIFSIINSSKGYIVRAKKECIDSNNKIFLKKIYLKTFPTIEEAKRFISTISNKEYYFSVKDLCEHYYYKILKECKLNSKFKELRYCFNLVSPIHFIPIYKLNDEIINNYILSIESKVVYRRVLTYLRKILKYGYEIKILKEDFSLKMKTKTNFSCNPRKKHRISKIQLKRLLSDYSNETVRDIIEIIVNTDIPLHVILNLKKENVDFNNKTISIRYKTKIINKVYELPSKILKILINRNSNNSEYYFTNRKGNRLEYSVFIRYYFKPFLKNNNLSEIKISDLYNLLNIESSDIYEWKT